MKRYWVEPLELDEIKIGDNDVEVMLASEVEAELAKKDMELQNERISHAIMTDSQNKEITRLRKALVFYGDEKNYKDGVGKKINWDGEGVIPYTPAEIKDDRGRIAREVLERKE